MNLVLLSAGGVGGSAGGGTGAAKKGRSDITLNPKDLHMSSWRLLFNAVAMFRKPLAT